MSQWREVWLRIFVGPDRFDVESRSLYRIVGHWIGQLLDGYFGGDVSMYCDLDD